MQSNQSKAEGIASARVLIVLGSESTVHTFRSKLICTVKGIWGQIIAVQRNAKRALVDREN